MIEEKEVSENDDEHGFKKEKHTLRQANTSRTGINSTTTMSLSSSTTATILQAYAARLSSDSDYAR